MKKIVAVLAIVIVAVLLVACNKMEQMEEAEKEKRNNLVFNLTRARYDNEVEKVDKYVADIFKSKELREEYIEKICSVGKLSIDSIGIQNIEYEIVNAGVKANIVKELVEKEGIIEDCTSEISKAGIMTFDIVFYDNKGKKCITKCKNFAFIHEEKWSMITLNEEK